MREIDIFKNVYSFYDFFHCSRDIVFSDRILVYKTQRELQRWLNCVIINMVLVHKQLYQNNRNKRIVSSRYSGYFFDIYSCRLNKKSIISRYSPLFNKITKTAL